VDLIDKPVTRGELFAALRRNFMGARGQVLVVAEDADAQRVLVSYLKEAGELAVTCAGSGREALAALDGALPDLIVLDQMMPTVDGLELLETLRGDHRSLDVPVIIVTARG
jgi:CheY-like chemotaxis protein